MRIVKMQIGSKVRVICVPDPKRKEACRKLLKKVQAICSSVDVHGVVHGCTPGTSPVTAAMPHVGFQFRAKADISNFFNSVRRHQLPREFANKDYDPCFVEYDNEEVPMQGLPTSPAVASIALRDADDKIVRFCDVAGVVYTRYVDDLMFSSNNVDSLHGALELAEITLKMANLDLNQSKTRILDASHSRSVFLGLSLGDDVRIPRKTRRRLRAALHQKNHAQARGLAEWCEMKMPFSSLAKLAADSNGDAKSAIIFASAMRKLQRKS